MIVASEKKESMTMARNEDFKDEIKNFFHWTTNRKEEHKGLSFSKKISEYEIFQQDICYTADIYMEQE